MSLAADPVVAAGGIAAYGQALRAGRLSAAAAVSAYLARIEAVDGAIGAYEYVDGAGALAAARAVDSALAAGRDPGPLAGLPVSIKDNFAVAGMPAHAGTRVPLEDLMPREEGSFVRRLRELGCVILGKTRSVEFALGITGLSAPRGAPRNPWDLELERVTGGSSSGAAAAMGAGLCALAVGTDTGGSVRVPAALCGRVGLKTSAGRWPLDGVLPLSHALDTIGLIAASAADAALAYAAVQGVDVPAPPDLAGVAFGLPRSYFYRGLAPEIAAATASALEALTRAGAVLREVDTPEAEGRDAYFPVALPASLIGLLGAERFRAQRGRMDPLVAARGDRGLDVTAEQLAALEAARAAHAAAAARRFADCAAWLTPTTTVTAPTVSELADKDRNWTLAMGMTQCSQPVNYLDLCAVSVPLPRPGAMPAGLQIVVPRGEEGRALALARAIEACLGPQPGADMETFMRSSRPR
ncbi:amidase [Achromobacter aloeverae]